MSKKPVSRLGEEARGAQRALRVRKAARRFMRDLDALADAREQHRMVADDIAAADGGKTDRRRIALARHAFAPVHGAVLQVAAERVGDDFAHRERGARRRIDLVTVMRLDDLDVVALGELLRGEFEQLEGHVHADAHVRREHDADLLARRAQLRLLRVVETGRADDHLHAVAHAPLPGARACPRAA